MVGPEECDVYVSCDPGSDKWGHELKDALADIGLTAFVARLPKWDSSLEWTLQHARAVVFCTKPGELAPRMLDELSRAGRGALVIPVAAGPLPGALDPWLPFAWSLDSAKPQAFASQLALMVAPTGRSASVGSVLKDLHGPVPASAIIRELFKIHPEYGGKRGREVRLGEEPSERVLPAETWLVSVRALFTSKEPKVHGRTMIVGLALLEPQLREQLQRHDGLFDAVAAELPLADILSSRGRELLGATPTRTATPPPTPAPARSDDRGPVVHDTVPLHTDNPAVVDQLNRKGFARVLAQRVRDMRVMETKAARPKSGFPRGRAFLVHVNGRWGAGKTSLLNFVREELEQGKTVRPFRMSDAAAEPWIVVDFNAWQHQRIVPPWWWLMGNVYRQGLQQLWKTDKLRAAWFWLREWAWRARAGWPWYLLAAAGAGAVAALWWAGAFEKLHHTDVVPIASGLVSLAIVVFGVIRGVARSMLSSSTRGAREYIQNTRDPMETAKRHFADLISWLHYPVAVFVDDLDRCKGDYIVQLLEGVQTLFRDVPVVYIVAADRDWLSDSYAAEYKAFVSLTDEPGRPLGYLFLEKTFQLTAAVHDLDNSALPDFWKGLVHAGAMPDEDELRAERVAAHRALKELSAEETRDAVLTDPGVTPAQMQARVEEMAMKMATQDVQEERQHVLLPFSELLERNPRALKRLVNAFGVARDLERLSGRNVGEALVPEHETALWTILNLRWPRLGEYLGEHPDDVDLIVRKQPPDDAPDDLKPLFRDDRVLAVVQGDAPNVHARLDSEVVALFAGRR